MASAILEQLRLPRRGFSLEVFVDRAGAVVGRPIRLVPFVCPPHGHGGLLRTQSSYLLFFRTNTDPLFRASIVYHELSHLLLGHGPVSDPAQLYDTAQEREADLLADIFLRCSLGWPAAGGATARERDRQLWAVFD